MTVERRRLGALLGVLAPAALVLLFVFLYGVNGPEWDHLNSTEIFDRWRSDRFTFEFLFRPHNEHRKALARLVTLGLGLVTRFNTRYEMYAHCLLLFATAGALFRGIPRERFRLAAFVPIAWVVLSPRGYESILGDGLPTYLSLLFSVLTIVSLAGGRSRSRLAVAMACAILATFSQSNGLLLWPIGALLLVSELRAKEQSVRAPTVIAWVAIGTAVTAAYFYGYKDPGNHPSTTEILRRPAVAAAYYLTVVGGWFATARLDAIAVGILTIAMFAVATAEELRRYALERTSIHAGWWLSLLSFATSAMITLHRANSLLTAGLESRYTPFSSLAAIGVYLCVVRARTGGAQLDGKLRYAAATVLVLGAITGTLNGWNEGPWWYSKKTYHAYLTYTAPQQSDSILSKELYPNPDHARIYAGVQRQQHLAIFSEPHVRAEDLILDATPAQFAIELVNGHPTDAERPLLLPDDDTLDLRGWAFDSTASQGAKAVFLVIDGRPAVPGAAGLYRPDLGGLLRGHWRRWSGIVASTRASMLTQGEHDVALAIVPDRPPHAFMTAPILRVLRASDQ